MKRSTGPGTTASWLPRGISRRVPRQHTGTIGRPVAIASAAHPLAVSRARLREAPCERAAAGRAMDPDRDARHADEHAAEEIWRERDAKPAIVDRRSVDRALRGGRRGLGHGRRLPAP